jgi:hypothetical protein
LVLLSSDDIKSRKYGNCFLVGKIFLSIFKFYS